MTDKEKIEAILNLLTDRNVGKLSKKGRLKNEDEEFGALVFATNAFRKALVIAKNENDNNKP